MPSAARNGERYRRSERGTNRARRHEKARIKEGEILWRFRSLCRNVITAFFIGPEASRTLSPVQPASGSMRAFYRPVAAGVTPADLDFLPFSPRNMYFAATENSPRCVCTLVIYFPADRGLLRVFTELVPSLNV